MNAFDFFYPKNKLIHWLVEGKKHKKIYLVKYFSKLLSFFAKILYFLFIIFKSTRVAQPLDNIGEVQPIPRPARYFLRYRPLGGATRQDFAVVRTLQVQQR